MTIICAWCTRDMGTKLGAGITHTICDECYETLLGEMPCPNPPEVIFPPKSKRSTLGIPINRDRLCDLPYPNQPDEYRQGKTARRHGSLIGECMYEDNTVAQRLWMLGWNDQNERPDKC